MVKSNPRPLHCNVETQISNTYREPLYPRLRRYLHSKGSGKHSLIPIILSVAIGRLPSQQQLRLSGRDDGCYSPFFRRYRL